MSHVTRRLAQTRREPVVTHTAPWVKHIGSGQCPPGPIHPVTSLSSLSSVSSDDNDDPAEMFSSQLYFNCGRVNIMTDTSKLPPDTKIWNPWIDVVQREALDLSAKKEEQTSVKNETERQTISSDSNIIPQNLMENLSETVLYNMDMNINRTPERKIKRVQPKTDIFKKTSRKLEKRSRSKTMKKIEIIKESCDCRFCYEDHILKMRMKSVKPFVFYDCT